MFSNQPEYIVTITSNGAININISYCVCVMSLSEEEWDAYGEFQSLYGDR